MNFDLKKGEILKEKMVHHFVNDFQIDTDQVVKSFLDLTKDTNMEELNKR